jgi:hypothetical protein
MRVRGSRARTGANAGAEDNDLDRTLEPVSLSVKGYKTCSYPLYDADLDWISPPQRTIYVAGHPHPYLSRSRSPH